jgi:hypothetical protein
MALSTFWPGLSSLRSSAPPLVALASRPACAAKTSCSKARSSAWKVHRRFTVRTKLSWLYARRSPVSRRPMPPSSLPGRLARAKLAAQAKLLRILTDGQLIRLGSTNRAPWMSVCWLQPIAILSSGSAKPPSDRTFIIGLPSCPFIFLHCASGAFLENTEKELFLKTLASTGGAQAEAARRMGLSRSALAYKLTKYGIKPAGE